MPGCAETQYIFDSSFELGYITSDVYDWLYNLDFNLDRIIDFSNGDISLDQLRSEFSEATCRELYYDNGTTTDIQLLVTEYFDLNYQRMDLVEKCFYDLHILFGSGEQPAAIKRQLASRIVDCHFGNQYHTPIMNIANETDMSNPLIQARVMASDLTVSKWANRMKCRRAQAIDNLSKVNIEQLRQFVFQKHHEREEKIQEHCRLMRSLRYQDGEVIADYSDSVGITINALRSGEKKKTFNRFDKKNVKRARKAINRAVDLFSKLFDRSDIEGFIKGYEYNLEGKKFNYRLTKTDRTNLLLNTLSPKNIHIPYDLEITDKNNVVLAKACYLFEDTPIIDQIIAFTMMIKSGNEDEFIKKANLFSVSKEFQGSELQKMKQIKSPTSSVPNQDDLIRQITEVDIMMAPLFLGAQEKHIWTNRIFDSLDQLLADHLNISIQEWNLLMYPNENIGAMMESPSLVSPQINLLTYVSP